MSELVIRFADPQVTEVRKKCTRIDVDQNSRYLSAYNEYGHVGSWPLHHIIVWTFNK